MQSGKTNNKMLKTTGLHSSGPALCPAFSAANSMDNGLHISKASLSVQLSCSVMSNSLQPRGLQHARPPCPSPAPGIYSLMSTESVMPSNISSCVASFSSHLQSFPASGSIPASVLCIRWPKYWSFSFSISPSDEYSGLISFRMDWLDHLSLRPVFSHFCDFPCIMHVCVLSHFSRI